MSIGSNAAKAVLVGGIAVAGLSQLTESASAAGFAIREQSAQYQGMSFAGNGAGRGLSVMFWNPAGAANKSGPGINLESHYSLIVPRSEVTVTSVSGSNVGADAFIDQAPPGLLQGAIAQGLADGFNAAVDAAFAGASPVSDNIGRVAVVPASYASYQLSKQFFVGMAINSPFGLVTSPDDQTYQGAVLGRTTKLFTTNFNPTVAYKVSPGISIGVGAQIQFADGSLKFATGTPDGKPSEFDGDDWAFGATAGVLLEPMQGTRIGVGWRSKLEQTLEGRFTTPDENVAIPGFTIPFGAAAIPVPGVNAPISTASVTQAEAEINLPDTVTVSFEQNLSPALRLTGTFEWANWSDFKELRVTNKGTGATIETITTNWDDSYFYSLGLSYDYSPVLTVRAGGAYEISPTSSPEKRLTSIPDANRTWLSAGATYQWSEATSFDFAYTHVFVADSTFVRESPGLGIELAGEVESAVDIVSASMKTKW